MNGAQALIRTLVDCGVDVCFSNPGTSEMHFVAALDTVPEMRGVLALFEGVATGAADGYARVADKPAATLLHLGPGLGNGYANLHNARRGNVPIVNVVGEHATFHKKYDAPLETDADALAGTLRGWVRRSMTPGQIGADAADAVAAAYGPPGKVATLLLPADTSWSEGGVPVSGFHRQQAAVVPDSELAEAAKRLKAGQEAVLFIGGPATREAGLAAANRVAAATGARLLCETFPTRLERGAGVPPVTRLGYLAEMAEPQLAGAKHLVVAGTRAPVAFFAYPGRPSDFVPEGCDVQVLASPGDDVVATLEALADLVGAPAESARQAAATPPPASGPLTAEGVAATVAALLPEGAVVVDEANTSGLWLVPALAGAPRHDELTLTGGAIGIGLPLATGAAFGAPDRPIIGLEADGSAMYTPSALWTQAREGLNVTTIVYNNAAYAILRMELQRVGAAGAGPKAQRLLDLSGPVTDFATLATSMGVPGVTVRTGEDLTREFGRALAEDGPHLIEAIVPPIL